MKNGKHVRTRKNQYLMRFELVIDYYACQSNLPCVSFFRIALFSRTCFKPCQDYIEPCTDVKMIEALGLVNKSQKANFYYAYTLSEPY